MDKKPDVGRVITRRGGTFSGTIALLATLAVLVGYFLPWTSWSDTVQGALQLTKADVVRQATSKEHTRDAARRTELGEAISGADWAAVLDSVEQSAPLDSTQQRRLNVARFGVKVLPYSAAILALLLLALSVPPRRVAKLGLGPVAGIVAVAQTRWVSTTLLLVVLACSLVVFLTSAVLVAGATVLGADGGAVGLGGNLMFAGSGVAFGAALIGYGPGRLRAVITSVLIFVAVVVGVYVYTHT